MVRKISSAPLPVADPRDPKVLKAAQMYEAQFLREMVRAMRQTVNESQLIKTNMAEKIFREQLDDEYVDAWVHVRGGVGLSDLIYDQIVERYGAQLGIAKPQGPVPKNFQGPLKVKSQGTKFKIQAPQSLLLSPWAGKITDNFRSPEGRQIVRIHHPEGLQSVFSFAGESIDGLKGSIPAGEIFGKTSGPYALIEWTLMSPEDFKPADV